MLTEVADRRRALAETDPLERQAAVLKFDNNKIVGWEVDVGHEALTVDDLQSGLSIV